MLGAGGRTRPESFLEMLAHTGVCIDTGKNRRDAARDEEREERCGNRPDHATARQPSQEHSEVRMAEGRAMTMEQAIKYALSEASEGTSWRHSPVLSIGACRRR